MAGLEGTRLGAYELVERIGGGGMAEVYRARQSTAFGREVAIKVIRVGFSEDEAFRERFLREAQAISKLSHPNILPLIEFGEENGTLYLVMPLAREGTLRDLLKERNGPLPLEEAVPLFTQLCDAVQYAHEEGIIHRDIKPQNVLLQRRTHVLLADFGIARDTAETKHMTTTGAGIGTVEYMAPEQAIGQADARSDIYSLGVVLYQLLTGHVPYSGSTPFQVLMKHTNEALPDPRLLNPNLPAEIVPVLQTALAKDPQRRFHSAQALGRAVQQVRPDATPDAQARPGAQPPFTITPPRSVTKQTTWHGQDFRDAPGEPVPPEFPSGPAPMGRTGVTGAPRTRTGPPGGWANTPGEAGDYDQPTWGTQGGRTGTTSPAWQQRGRTGPPPYAGGGQYPQQPAPASGRGTLLAALIGAAVLILILSSVAAAYGLGLFGSSSGPQTAQHGTPTGATQPTATATATATDTPTPTATPSPTPTDTPTPTPTPVPVFKVTGITATVTPPSWNYSPCGPGTFTQKFTFNATVSVNAAPDSRTFTYYWTRSDGASGMTQTVTVPASDTSITLPPETWQLGFGVPPGTYWERVVVTDPNNIMSNKTTFTITCS